MLLKVFNKISAVGKKKKVEEEVKKAEDVALLEEIRDLLKKNNK